MTADREQTRRDAEMLRDFPEGPASLHLSQQSLALLAELEQAERRLGVLNQERDAIAEALSQAERVRDAAQAVTNVYQARLAKVPALVEALRKTIYSPPGYSGPEVWWAEEARQALAAYEQEQA